MVNITCVFLLLEYQSHTVNAARNWCSDLSMLACCALQGSSHATLTVRITARACDFTSAQSYLQNATDFFMENAHRLKVYISLVMSTFAPSLPFILRIPLDLSPDVRTLCI